MPSAERDVFRGRGRRYDERLVADPADCMQIGPYTLDAPLILAPMAGVTDRPFRQLCRSQGAALAVGEMVAANPALRDSRKSRLRTDHRGEPEPRVVQIAGAEPGQMAEAARYNVARGAEIIDINMGCPAKKVCNKMAGSALLGDEGLVRAILEAVVAAVEVPVTLKIRTGLEPRRRNAVRVAELAEDAGIQALAVHGRTRADAYRGQAEYATIAEVKRSVGIAVIANGDITTPERAEQVLEWTGADAIMIGRGAHGRPWLFRQIRHYLAAGTRLSEPDPGNLRRLILDHLAAMYRFYGDYPGVRIARKHIAWYVEGRPGGAAFRRRVMAAGTAAEQRRLVADYLNTLPALAAA